MMEKTCGGRKNYVKIERRKNKLGGVKRFLRISEGNDNSGGKGCARQKSSNGGGHEKH